MDLVVVLFLMGMMVFGFFSVYALAGVVFGGLAVLRGAAHERALQQKREAELEEIGLRREGPVWVGTLDGIEVQYQTRLVQVPKGSTAHHWQIAVPSSSLFLGLPGEGEDILMGDARFDARFKIRGRAEDLALLTPRTRELLLELPDVALKDGQLACQLPLFDVRALWSLMAVADEMWRMPASAPGRLEKAVTDPLSGVRLRSLAAATELELELGKRLALGLREDQDPEVRAMAHMLLREDGLEDTASRPSSLRRWAIYLVDCYGTVGQRLRVARGLLAQPSPSLRDDGFTLLRPLGSEAESVLLEILPEVDSEMLGKILIVLGEVGTVAAVPVLRERQGKLSVLQAGLSKAIDHAVLSIQGRLGGERGGLALAGAPSQQGALALAGQPGALSQARRERV